MDIMTALFDEEEIARRYHLEIQRNAEKKIAKNLLDMGTISYEEIADCTGFPVSEIEKLVNLQPV